MANLVDIEERMTKIPIHCGRDFYHEEMIWLLDRVGKRNRDWWFEPAGGVESDQIVLVVESDELALEYIMRWK